MAYTHLIFIVTLTCGIYAQQTSIANYTATFNNIGIEITTAGTASPENGITAVFRSDLESTWHDCHPLSRIASNRFAGSIFNLEPGAKYLIRIRSSPNSDEHIDTIATRKDLFPFPNGTVYHVAKSGNDANTGTSETKAFATLGHALTLAQAGTTILIHEGHYFESVTIPRSGTQNDPILIRNAPGEKVILDGRDTSFKPSWTPYNLTANIYRSDCYVRPHFAYYNGEHIFASPSLDDLVRNTWNMPAGFFCDGKLIYIRLAHTGAPTPADTLTIPAYSTGITCSGKQFIQIRGLEICYFGLEEYPRGIYFDGSSFNLVDSCNIHHNGIGVAFKRASNFNTVQHCRFTESPIDSWRWSAVKEGTGYYEAGGIMVYGSSSVNSGNVIRNNNFTHMFDGSHIFSDDESGPTTNMDFFDNRIEFVNDDCIETDGAGSNCRIYNNFFRNFLTGVSVAPAAIGPTYIFRNLFTGWKTHDSYVGYPVKFNVDSDLKTDFIYIYNNTCFTSESEQPGFLFKDYSDWNNVISRNNIYAGTGYAFESWPNQNPVDYDYDLLYTSTTGKLITWAGTRYNTIAAFSDKTGQEKHGISSDPLFVSVAGSDFHLSKNSPAIDKGVVVPNISDHYSGTGPDIGCYEYGTSNRAKHVYQTVMRTDFIVYWNRSAQTLILKSNGTSIHAPVSINISDCLGRCIYQGDFFAGSDNFGIPVKSLQSGIYVVKISTGKSNDYLSVIGVRQ